MGSRSRSSTSTPTIRRRAWRRRGSRRCTAAKFGRDFLIDLVGYRRYGHNEGDEPSFTQPVMYRSIPSHPTVREIWARTLEGRGAPLPEAPDAIVKRYTGVLEAALDEAQRHPDQGVRYPEPAPRGTARHVATAVPLERLRALNGALMATPEGFTVHRKLERIRERRRTVLDDPEARTIDWGAAEDLAQASLLEDGVPIRLTGEDVERGTFSHRHAVLHDAETGRRFTPLQKLPQARASYEIHNSPLSENATIGFEFGYNVQEPATLVLWEAQYGDFINGAQVIIDAFLTSARAKWGLTPSLVLLLPHGYEGQGPEHSSARLERFLEAAADINLRVANCTTAAQYFHLLRRQAALLLTDPLPLVVLDAEEPAAASHGGVAAAGPRRRPLGARAHRPGGARACARRAPRHPVQRQGVRRPDLERLPRPAPGDRRLPDGAALSVPVGRPAGDPRHVPQPERDRLGAGGAREHGRVGVRASAAGGDNRRPLPAPLRRPRTKREPIGRLDGVAHEEPADAHRRSLRPDERAHADTDGLVEAGIDAAPYGSGCRVPGARLGSGCRVRSEVPCSLVPRSEFCVATRNPNPEPGTRNQTNLEPGTHPEPGNPTWHPEPGTRNRKNQEYV